MLSDGDGQREGENGEMVEWAKVRTFAYWRVDVTVVSSSVIVISVTA